MSAPPDPVKEAREYQQFILCLLADDNPAEVQAGTPAALRQLIRDAGDRLRLRPGSSEWSVMEAIGHIVDGEVVSSARYRWILGQDEPRLAGYDQDQWQDRLRHNEDDPEELLSLFEALRAANLALWSRSSEADRARMGIHEERGPESYEFTFRLIAGHDRNHLEQARATLGMLGSESPEDR